MQDFCDFEMARLARERDVSAIAERSRLQDFRMLSPRQIRRSKRDKICHERKLLLSIW
jgi:hypothetical protein